MERIPEPELMTELEQVKAYANADFEAVNRSFVDAVLAFYGPDEDARVLDLGCGPGDIACKVGSARPGWDVLGVDGSGPMLLWAESASHAQKLNNVHFRKAYLPHAPFDEPFDLILSNSLLHHLPKPEILWETIRQNGKVGTRFFVMDLSRPESQQTARAIVDTHSGNEPDVLRSDFFHSLLAAYRPEEVLQQIADAGIENARLFLPSERHWIVSGTL